MGRKRVALKGGVNIRTYPSGRKAFRIQFQFRGTTCKETLKGLDPDKAQDRRAANHIKDQIEYEIARQSFNYADHFPDSNKAALFGFTTSNLTVSDITDAYIDDLETAGRERTTIAAYRRGAARVNEHIGHLRVVDLMPEHIRAMIRARQVSRKTWTNDLRPLRGALNRQVNDGVIPFSPLDRVVINELVPKSAKPAPDPFTLDEIAAIIEAAEGPALNLIEFALFTGLRIEELAALHWDDIGEGVVEVRRAAMLSLATGATKPPKTASSHRVVKLLPRADDALKRQLRLTRWGKEHVFCRLQGSGPITRYRHINRAWRGILKAAGVRYRPFKQTRHSYITHMLGSGQNPLYVASQAGHRGTNMLDVYARWVEDWKESYQEMKYGT